MVILKTKNELQLMQKAGALTAAALHAGGAARIAAEDGTLRVRREEPSIPAAAET